jgi:hypothetical protein
MTALVSAPSPDLKLVKDGRNQDLLKIINDGNYPPLVQLEKKYGISIYHLKKDYGAIPRGRGRPKQPKPFVEPKKRGRPPKERVVQELPPPPRRSLERVATGTVLFLSGLVLGCLEVSFDWQFYSSMGRTPAMVWSLGIGGAAIGVMNMLVPASLSDLRDQPGLLWTGRLLALACFGMTVLADVSMSATNIGDTTQIRDDTAKRHSELVLLLKQVEADRKLIPNPLVLEQQIRVERNSVPLSNLAVTRDCSPEYVTKSWFFCDKLMLLRKSKAEAETKLEKLDAKWKDYSDELKALPAFSSAAPGAEQISSIARGSISVAIVQSVQICVFAVLLALSPGFLLAFARPLLHRR